MKNQKGFTQMEIMITTGIVAILSLMAVIACLTYLNKAKASECECSRLAIEQAERHYNMDNNTQCLNVQELVKTGHLRREPVCASRGQYFWVSKSCSDTNYPEAGCTVHKKE